jgi:hypothetical protein
MLLVLFAVSAGAQQQRANVQLVAGLELTYAANGTPSPPWRVESVERDVSLGGRTGCLRVRYAPGGPRAGADVRVTCEADGIIFAWDSTRATWRPSRTVRVSSSLDISSGANVNSYATFSFRVDTVGVHPVRVLETHLVTKDSTGKPVRRLSEFYSPALATATWGKFERPDPSVPGGWKVEQEFKLVAIKLP